MAFIPTPNTVRVILQFDLTSSVVEMTFAVTKSTPWASADFDDLMPAVSDWYEFELCPHLSQDLLLFNIKATDISSETGTVREYPVSPVLPGGMPNDSLPANAAYVVTFNTPLRGRSYRGRSYTPGIPDVEQDDSQFLNGTWCTLIQAAWSYLTSYLEDGWEQAVVSLFHDLAARETGVATAIDSYTGDFAIDSQRRRLAGRGM